MMTNTLLLLALGILGGWLRKLRNPNKISHCLCFSPLFVFQSLLPCV